MNIWSAATILQVIVAVTGAGVAETRQVWLDELDVSKSVSGVKGAMARRSVDNVPLKVNGETFERGVGTHAPCTFKIQLFCTAARFTATVGIDDDTKGQGSVVFRLVGDGRELWSSSEIRASNPVVKVDVPLTGVRYLECIVDPSKDGTSGDHGDWLDAKIAYEGRKPQAVPVAPQEGDKLMRQAMDAAAVPQPEDRDDLDAALRRTETLIAHMRTMKNAPDMARADKALMPLRIAIGETEPSAREARVQLAAKLDAVRRQISFANPLLNFNRLLFVKKHYLPKDEGLGNHMCDQYFGFHGVRGGGLFVLDDPFGAKPVLRDILKDTVCENGRFKGQKLNQGAFLSPDLSYDGKSVLFAYTEAEPSRYQWSERSTYHVFKVNVDGTGLQQLTDGVYNDFDPCWLPDGRIVFISERRGGFGRCHGRPVPSFTLHVMNADGTDIRCLSPHETNEWQPSVANDGTIVYTRWDYVDRGFNQAHHPWITTPDGTDSRAIHGNFRSSGDAAPFMEMDVRAIPGSHKFVATAAAHHGQAFGSLVVIDPRIEDDNAMAPLKRLTPDARFPEAEGYGQERYASAWPLDESFYLCSHDPEGNVQRGTNNNFAVYLLDAFGNKEMIYRDPAISCLNPMPLRPRPMPPVLAARSKPDLPPGMALREKLVRPVQAPVPVGVLNVYDTILPFPKGTKISQLRIVQLLPKTTPIANNPRIGLGDQKSARKILGTVPVEKDGSAYFLVPEGVPVYFQVLDERGFALQSMRSATYVHENAPLMCVGCHNPKQKTPDGRLAFGTAFQRPPSRIAPDVDGTSPFSYPRLVQPVLDSKCVECHTKNAGKAPDLRKGEPDKNPNNWYTSINSLRPFVFFFDSASFTTPLTTPGQFGMYGSKLYTILTNGHHKVQLSKDEMHRLAVWMDNNCDFFGSYENLQAQARGDVIAPTME